MSLTSLTFQRHFIPQASLPHSYATKIHLTLNASDYDKVVLYQWLHIVLNACLINPLRAHQLAYSGNMLVGIARCATLEFNNDL
jgi:hypothetical protein